MSEFDQAGADRMRADLLAYGREVLAEKIQQQRETNSVASRLTEYNDYTEGKLYASAQFGALSAGPNRPTMIEMVAEDTAPQPPTGFPYFRTDLLPGATYDTGETHPLYRTTLRSEGLLVNWSDPDKNADLALARAQAENPEEQYPIFGRGARLSTATMIGSVLTEIGANVTSHEDVGFVAALAFGSSFGVKIARLCLRKDSRESHTATIAWHAVRAHVDLDREQAQAADQGLFVQSSEYDLITTRAALDTQTIPLANGDTVPVTNVLEVLQFPTRSDYPSGNAIKVIEEPDDPATVHVTFNPAKVAARLLDIGGQSTRDEIVADSLDMLAGIDVDQKLYETQATTLHAVNELASELPSSDVDSYTYDAEATKRNILTYTLGIGAVCLSRGRHDLEQALAASVSEVEIPADGELSPEGAILSLKRQALQHIQSDFKALADPFKPESLAEIYQRMQRTVRARL